MRRKQPIKQAIVSDDELLRLVEDSMDGSHPKASSLLLGEPRECEEILKKTDQDGSPNGQTLLTQRKPQRHKDSRKQKYSRDVCEMLELCAECYANKTQTNPDSICLRTESFINKLGRMLILTDQWMMDTWETLNFGADSIGFSCRLALYLVDHAVTHPHKRDAVVTAIKILRNAPHPNSVPHKIMNRKDIDGKQNILPINDLHIALEKVLHNCISSSRVHDMKQEREYQAKADETSFHFYRLLQALHRSECMHESFIQRLPTEFLNNLLTYLNLINHDGHFSADIEEISSSLSNISEYKIAVNNYFNNTVLPTCTRTCSNQEVLQICAAFLKSHPSLVHRHEFVRRLSMAACSLPPEHSEAIIYATEALAQFGVLIEDDLQIGLERLLIRVEDMLLDCPSFDFAMSRLVFKHLCENVISLNVVENWIRMRVGSTMGMSVLRRCFYWLEKRPLIRTNRHNVMGAFDFVRGEIKSPDIEFLHDELGHILRIMSTSEDITNLVPLAAVEVERNLNVFPDSAYHITLMLLSYYAIPEVKIGIACYYILNEMRSRKFISDPIIKSSMEEYITNGSLLSDSYASSAITRKDIVHALELQLQDPNLKH